MINRRTLIFVGMVSLTLPCRVFGAVTASMSIGGTTQSSGTVWDQGTISVLVNGYVETISYGQFSTPASIASSLAAKFTETCGSPAKAYSAGNVIYFQARGTATSLTLQFAEAGNSSVFSQNSFQGQVLTGIAAPVGGPIVTDVIHDQISSTSITVLGNNFGSSGTVTLNGSSLPIYSWTNTTITTSVPTTSSTGLIAVVVQEVSSNVFNYSGILTVPPNCGISPDN